jgi:hypothetical protein
LAFLGGLLSVPALCGVDARALSVFDLGSNLRFAYFSYGLTTFLTTIRAGPSKSTKVKTFICKRDRMSTDSLGRAADVWGSSARELNLLNRKFLNASFETSKG